MRSLSIILKKTRFANCEAGFYLTILYRTAPSCFYGAPYAIRAGTLLLQYHDLHFPEINRMPFALKGDRTCTQHLVTPVQFN